jgi:hypothetical protein
MTSLNPTGFKITKSLFFWVVLFAAVGFLHSGSASAANPPPNNLHPSPGPLPAGVYDYLAGCNRGTRTPAFQAWVSPSGDPSSLSMTVPAGTTSATLQYNFNGAYCIDNSDVLETRSRIFDVSAGVTATTGGSLIGNAVGLNFPGNGLGNAGSYDNSTFPFKYTPAGGFRSGTNTYSVTIQFQTINHFQNGDKYICVAGSEQNAGGGFNYDRCTAYQRTFSIEVTVPSTTNDYAPSGSMTLNCSAGTVSGVESDNDRPTDGARVVITVYGARGVAVYGADSNWTYTIPDIYRDGTDHVINGTARNVDTSAQPAGTDVTLNGSGLTYNSGGCGTIVPPPPPPAGSNSISCSNIAASSLTVNFTYSAASAVGVNRTLGYSTTDLGGKSDPGPNGGSINDTGLTPDIEYLYNLYDKANSSLLASVRCTPTASSPTPPAPPPPPPPPPTSFGVSGTASVSLDSDESPNSYSSSGSYSVNPPPPSGLSCFITVTQTGKPPVSSTAIPCSAGNSVTGPSPSGITGVAGDQFCATITVDPGSGYVDPYGNVVSSGGPSTSSPNCVTVANKPYFKVFNSSVTTGGDVNGPPSATPGALAGWYNNSGGNGYGASAQLGAYALVNITGFASNQTGNRIPTGLSFANSGLPLGSIGSDKSSPKLGGLLDGNNSITPLATVPTSFNDGGSSGGSVNFNTLVNPGSNSRPEAYSYGSTASPVDLVLKNPANKPVDPGQNRGIYVVGNLYIKHNLTYNQASPWTLGSLPSLVVVVTGNIYIDKGVTQLDGTYESLGSIYTCADDETFSAVAANSLYTNCNKQLTVTGSFVAKKLNLLRTFGSLRDEAGGPSSSCSNPGSPLSAASHATCAAEVFEFSPEQYLQKPAARSSGATVRYDAITSLPPVL